VDKKDTLFNLSMLILRVVLGTVFVIYGSQKLFGMFGGMGLEGTAKMLESLGVGKAYIVAAVWGVVELTGGLFIFLGILARWATSLIFILMFAHLIKIDLAYGMVFQKTGMEYTLMVLASCTPIMLMGGGSWSVWDA